MIFFLPIVLDVQITVGEKEWDTIRFQNRDIETEFQEERKSQPIDRPYTYVEASLFIALRLVFAKRIHWLAKFQPSIS